MGSRYLSAAKVAELLDTSPGVLANLRCHGEGPPYIKFRRRILYDVRDLEEWIDRHKVKTMESSSPAGVGRHSGDNVWKGGRKR